MLSWGTMTMLLIWISLFFWFEMAARKLDNQTEKWELNYDKLFKCRKGFSISINRKVICLCATLLSIFNSLNLGIHIEIGILGLLNHQNPWLKSKVCNWWIILRNIAHYSMFWINQACVLLFCSDEKMPKEILNFKPCEFDWMSLPTNNKRISIK